ncbi:peptidase inhibitor family I36 protein [Streptomyces sp. ISL-112]|uniref:peptidase inhibitor family I36 protein n=1 Tax=unclassified Streptomyces TaxID=2593676 RepID=UPI001BED2016|nr:MULTISPECIES: peptidase inhibitor family I36 protein [unclassified Streptomyces]MBT2429184.1 peptidase inhibitor family I36 protein [Streptomyces sp. ISL-112]MBT2463514.1 peptidase inhibitor family I36 protein [Streptomyces sp. ISL-63]
MRTTTRTTTRTNRTTVLAAGLAVMAFTALVPQALAQDRAAPDRSAATPATAPDVRLGSCEAGRLCLWKKPDFTGARQTYELSTVDIESCTPLPGGGDAQSLANRTGRPVTTYQSAECQEAAEFETYPGGGIWLPRSPYQVRAFKIWEN